jgi:hypothetical protein
LVILAIFCSYFGLIIWVSKLLALGSADEELFSEMAIQDIKIGIDWFFFYMQKLLSCQVSENSKHHIRTSPNKPYRTKRELSTPKSRSTHVEHTKAIVCKNVN